MSGLLTQLFFDTSFCFSKGRRRPVDFCIDVIISGSDWRLCIGAVKVDMTPWATGIC